MDFLKIVSLVKLSQDEEIRFIKGNVLKVTQNELHSFLLFKRVKKVKNN